MIKVANSATQGLCALLLGGAIACAQSPPSAAPPSASTTDQTTRAARIALARALADSLDEILTAALADRAFPGAYAIVGDSRGVLAERGVGRIDWPASAPLPTDSTVWDLASLTKVVATATAAAQLVERGRIDLDAPVQTYLPEWTGPGQERVTIRHLLTHTSGLPAFKPYDTITKNRDSIATLIYRTPLERAAGERTVYSDIGAYVLGRVIERVSGATLDAYFRQEIATPLGLKETMFVPPAALRARIAPTEIDTLRGGLVHGAVHDERAYYLGGVSAHAGLFGSARDLARYATMLLRGGALDGARILRPETIARFTAYQDSTVSNRALGWQKPEHAAMRDRASSAWAGQHMSSRAFGHTGFTGTSIAIDPSLDLYVILLSNRVNPTRDNPRITPVRRRIADAVVTAVVRHRQGTNAEGQ